MTASAENHVDRTGWASGPWDNEPDRIEFQHAGLPCLMVRNRWGVWCGYAAVPEGHPLFEVAYSENIEGLRASWEARKLRPIGENPSVAIMLRVLSGKDDPSPEVVIDVHGGLTYSDHCQGRICHVAKPGEPDKVWWFGFDCGHYKDFSPYSEASNRKRFKETGDPVWRDNHEGKQYRDVAYVRREVESLAEQLVALQVGAA